MPITWSFTLAAAIALVLTTRKLLRHVWNREALYQAESAGQLVDRDVDGMKRSARMLLLTASVMTLINLALLLAGLGNLIGHRELGWALVLLPVFTVLATFVDPG